MMNACCACRMPYCVATSSVGRRRSTPGTPSAGLGRRRRLATCPVPLATAFTEGPEGGHRGLLDGNTLLGGRGAGFERDREEALHTGLVGRQYAHGGDTRGEVPGRGMVESDASLVQPAAGRQG